MKPLLISIVIAQLLTACGEFSYKRGASVRDLDLAKKACSQTGNEAAQLACLREAGWTIAPIGDDELFAHASVSENQPHATSQPTPTPAKTAVADTGVSDNHVSNTATEPTTKKENSPSITSRQEENSLKNTPKLNTPAQVPNDDTRYMITSWWKFGGHPELLKRDMKSCEDALGETHKPDRKAQQYTRAFVVCLHQKGWKGLKAN